MKTNKTFLLALFAIWCQTAALAQSDPVLMTVNGKPVPRSEFEYSFNKNNQETVIDRKSVDEYVDLFINYKLKVEAALEAGIDTTKAFKSEFLVYRDQQIRPSFITDDDLEREAKKVYKATQSRVDSTGGLVRPAHILVTVRQKATQQQQDSAKMRIDSIYDALRNGADFAEMARKYSDDKGSAKRGGDISWIQKGQTIKEFEDKVFSMKKGELSEPFLSPVGYHIVELLDKGNFFPYDSVHANILQFLDQRGVREKLITQNIDSIAKMSKGSLTSKDIVNQRAAEMEAKDSDLKYLIKEYHDGLLLYEISNRNVWEKAAKDEQALDIYFKKNKKKYRWDSPRFKGIAYHVKDAADIQAVKNAVKGVPFKDWGETLRQAFNDSTIRILVVKGYFKEGDNEYVDKKIFNKNIEVAAKKDYPLYEVYGEKLKSPKSYEDVRGQVVADYQEELEKEWVKELRKKYAVDVDKQVLATVNKH